MKFFALTTSFMLVTALLLTASSTAQSVELFSNNGFEGTFGGGDVNNESNWHEFNNGGTTSAGTGTTAPLNGVVHGQISIEGDANSFAGLQQQAAVIPGETYTFSFFGEDAATPALDVGIEYRIEWIVETVDPVTGVSTFAENVPARSQLTATTFGTSYSQFSVSGVAPADADFGRAVIALQSFQGGTQGIVRIDDTSFTGPAAVPEPSAIALLGLGGLGLATRRRRR